MSDANPPETEREEMQDSHTSMQIQKDLIAWRRSRALSMYATGKTLSQIAAALMVDISTISRDLDHLRKEAKAKHGEYIENLPFEHQKSIASIDLAHKELWELYEKESDSRQKKALLDSIGDIVIKRQILLGDPQHIDRALKTVARVRKQLEEQEQEAAT